MSADLKAMGDWSEGAPDYHPGVAHTRAPRTAKAPAESPGLPAFMLALYIVLAATTTGVVLHEGGPAFVDYQLRWSILVSDVALAGVILTQLPAVRALWTARSRHFCALGAAILAVSLLPALVAHPSARGALAEFRWIGVAMAAFGVGRLGARAATWSWGPSPAQRPCRYSSP